MDEKNMTFLDHLTELRNRLIIVALVFTVLLIACFSQADKIMELILEPINRAELIYISPSELLTSLFKISAIMALLLSLPMILLQVFLFIKPAFDKKEVLSLVLILLVSIILLALGIAFGYMVMLPMSLNFLMGIRVAGIEASFVLKNYISYALSIVFMCGISFELPLAVIALERLNILSLEKLTSSRKYVLLIVAIVSAFLTPPDVISQSLLIVPLMLLYEFSIIFVKIFGRKKR